LVERGAAWGGWSAIKDNKHGKGVYSFGAGGRSRGCGKYSSVMGTVPGPIVGTGKSWVLTTTRRVKGGACNAV